MVGEEEEERVEEARPDVEVGTGETVEEGRVTP